VTSLVGFAGDVELNVEHWSLGAFLVGMFWTLAKGVAWFVGAKAIWASVEKSEDAATAVGYLETDWLATLGDCRPVVIVKVYCADS
jgi:hypothetical protein